jgi:hypothetical protein
LPRHSARRFALFEKAGLVDHQHCIVIRQMLDDIVAHDIAQGTSVSIDVRAGHQVVKKARSPSAIHFPKKQL